MFLEGIPSELFEIAASFKDTDFRVNNLIMLELNEFQIRVEFKREPDAAIYFRFVRNKETIVSFGEANGGAYSDNFKWSNRDDVIQKFINWYNQLFDYPPYESEPEVA
jgi:hypothetical protein